jgi:phosphoglycolate phosphatase
MNGEEVAHQGWRTFAIFSDVLKLLVFDLDGTLADTRRDLAEAVNHVLAGAGRPALPLEQVMRNVGNGAERLIASCLADSLRLAPDGPAEPRPGEVPMLLKAFLDHYGDHCTAHTRPYPGLAPAMQKLRPRRMAVLTNKPAKPSRRILDALGLSGFFDLMVCGDSGFGQKPDAAGLRHILATMEVAASQAAMIGDGPQDAGAARAAGTRLIGFLDGIAPREAMLRERPDAAIASMEDLPAAVAALEAGTRRAGELRP